ncbi:MAG: RNA methyltransferase [Ignavibacteriales bacterium]|nr:RNA methyltransferase [Ignavibacteriales bacterium]
MISKAKLKDLQKLSQKKSRESEGMFLIEGIRSLDEALTAGAVIEWIFTTQKDADSSEIVHIREQANKKGIPAAVLSDPEFARLSEMVTSQGIVAVVRNISQPPLESIATAQGSNSAIVVALDAVADPGNLGAIIRTCDWFGAAAILLGKGCVELYNPKVVRATMGSLFHLPILEDVDLQTGLASLGKDGWDIFAAELTGTEDLRNVRRGQKTVLVIGNEAHGISADVSRAATHHVCIPSFGKAESLNAGIAAGVFLSHFAFNEYDH